MTHVSYNGYLIKVNAVLDFYRSKGYQNMEFISYGRLVNPNGHYANAPVVKLYRLPNGGGYVAVQ